MVTNSLSDDGVGGGESRSPASLRYGDTFDEMCGYYLSIGMSYSDYWDGDNCMAKYYREADERRREKENYNMWLQGGYFYEALLDASPILNALSGKKKPLPYRSAPLPVTHGEANREKERTNKQKLQNGKDAMRAIMTSVNKKFQEKE